MGIQRWQKLEKQQIEAKLACVIRHSAKWLVVPLMIRDYHNSQRAYRPAPQAAVLRSRIA